MSPPLQASSPSATAPIPPPSIDILTIPDRLLALIDYGDGLLQRLYLLEQVISPAAVETRHQQQHALDESRMLDDDDDHIKDDKEDLVLSRTLSQKVGITKSKSSRAIGRTTNSGLENEANSLIEIPEDMLLVSLCRNNNLKYLIWTLVDMLPQLPPPRMLISGQRHANVYDGFQCFNELAPDFWRFHADHYSCLVNGYRWCESVLGTLLTLGQDVVLFQFEENCEFMRPFYDLLALYIKVHLLVGSMKLLPHFVALFSLAFHLKVHTADTDIDAIAEWTVVLHRPPEQTGGVYGAIAYLQELARKRFPKALARKLSLGLEGLSPSMLLCTRDLLSCLVEGTLLDINVVPSPDVGLDVNLDDVDDINVGSVEEHVYRQICHSSSFLDWTVFTFLLLPGELVLSDVLDMVTAVLEEYKLYPICRDITIDIHDFYIASIHSPHYPDIARTNVRDSVIAAINQCAAGAILIHEERIRLLADLLADMSQTLKEKPQTLVPRLPVALATLTLARTELLWFLRTGEEASSGIAEMFPEVIYNYDKILRYLAGNRQRIQSYYLEWVIAEDYKICRRLVHQLLQLNPDMDHNLRVMLKRLVIKLRLWKEAEPKVLARLTTDGVTPDFTDFRMEWFRVSAALSSSSYPHKPHHEDCLATLITRMNSVVQHMRYVDRTGLDLETYLKFIHLHELWWYHSFLYKCFKPCLDIRISCNTHWALSYLRIVANASDGIHRFRAQEMNLIGDRCVRLAKQWLADTIHTFTDIMRNLVGPDGFGALHGMLGQDHVAQWLASKKRKPIPGYESRFGFKKRAIIQDMLEWRLGLMKLCESMRDAGIIKVFDSEFAPIEYVREALQRTGHLFFTELCMRHLEETHLPLVPSKLSSGIRTYLKTLHTLRGYLPIDVDAVVRVALMKHSFSEDMGSVDNLIAFRRPMVRMVNHHVMASIYASLFIDILRAKDAKTCIFSPLLRCFVTIVRPTALEDSFGNDVSIHKDDIYYTEESRSQALFRTEQGRVLSCATISDPVIAKKARAEVFTDNEQLHNLVSILGPYGVRFIEHQLLSFISKDISAILQCIKDNSPGIVELSRILDPNFRTDLNSVEFVIGNINGLKCMPNHLISIGRALSLVELIRDAQRRSLNECAPLLLEAISYSQQLYPTNVMQFPGWIKMDGLAKTSGLTVPDVVDVDFKNVCSDLKVSGNDEKAWDLLPVLLATIFAIGGNEGGWQRCLYNSNLEAFNNDSHCIATAIVKLLVSVTSIFPGVDHVPVAGRDSTGAVNIAVRSCLIKFIEFASVLQLEYGDIAGALTLVQASNIAPYFGAELLEKNYPYALFRTFYAQEYHEERALEKQLAKNRKEDGLFKVVENIKTKNIGLAWKKVAMDRKRGIKSNSVKSDSREQRLKQGIKGIAKGGNVKRTNVKTQ